MICKQRLIVGLALAIPLAACGKPQEAANTTENTAAAPTETSSTVERQVVTPAPVAPAPIQQAVIQTQPGPRGSQVALNKVAVTGDVLTVQLTYSTGSGTTWAKLDDISVIDDATAQRISVLKDNAGKWLASPLGGSGKDMMIETAGPSIVWMKFPAPPATSKTVSINIPDVAPFDGVPVTR